jgi:hypothetical protein
MRWEELAWNYLSFQERQDWTMLGWNETSWNAAHVTPIQTPQTQQPCYQDLTEDQQDAVRSLKYNILTWHACKNPDCPWPQDAPHIDAPCFERMLWLEAKYHYTIPWGNLSTAKRTALELLGWSSVRWSTADPPDKYGRPWADMMLPEREAAEFLGYEEDTWEGCVAETPCITLLEHLDNKTEDLQWSTMPSGVRKNLEILNWTYNTWLGGVQPYPYKSEWQDLALMHSVAARKIGFVTSTWALCPNAPCSDRFDYLQRRYDLAWLDMTLAQRWAWELLDHSEELWLDGGMPNTRTMERPWEELSPEQQDQAKFLRASSGTWSGCSEVNIDASAGGDAANHTLCGDQPLPNDPLRPVRARMTIERPFSEVSGNIFGSPLQQLPMSFIMVFESAVARALFCENPPLSDDPSTYVGASGQPLCLLQSNYDRQQGNQRECPQGVTPCPRIRVETVREGSIIVDFIIEANVSSTEPPAILLFEELERQLARGNSPIAHDVDFGRFANYSSVQEVCFDHLTEQERMQALADEVMRGQYDAGNACELRTDNRNGFIACPITSSARSVVYGRYGMSLLLVAAAAIVRPRT